jgi:hypothetical protein
MSKELCSFFGSVVYPLLVRKDVLFIGGALHVFKASCEESSSSLHEDPDKETPTEDLPRVTTPLGIGPSS